MNNLSVFQKMFDTTLYLYVALRQFPKSERFTLAADLKISAYRIMELMIFANKSRNKIKYLIEMDVELEMLRMKIRLAHDLKFLSTKKYSILSAKLTEIGKMLGGWIKSQKGL